MFKSDMMPRLSVRFPTDLHSWIADQSFEGHCSMNAVVVEAVQAFKVLRAGEGRGRKHAAAVSLAIASAHLARGTAMFTKSGEHAFETVLLVQYPGKGELTVYARISDGRIEMLASPALRDDVANTCSPSTDQPTA